MRSKYQISTDETAQKILAKKREILASDIKQDQNNIATVWAKTFKHNDPNDPATNMMRLQAACVAFGNFKTRDVGSANFKAPSNALTVVDYLSHGSRVILDYSQLSQANKESFLQYFPNQKERYNQNILERTSTHDVTKKDGEIKEGKGFILGMKGMLAKGNYGANIAVGGEGQENFCGKTITANGFSGHVFYYLNEESDLVLLGPEQSAPHGKENLQKSENEQYHQDKFGQGHSLVGASDEYTTAESLYFSDPIYQAKLLAEKDTLSPDKYGAMQVAITDDNWEAIKKYLNKLQNTGLDEKDYLELLLTKPISAKPQAIEDNPASYIELDFEKYFKKHYEVFIKPDEKLADKEKQAIMSLQNELLTIINTIKKAQVNEEEYIQLKNTITQLLQKETPDGYKKSIERVRSLFEKQHTINHDLQIKQHQFMLRKQHEELTEQKNDLLEQAKLFAEILKAQELDPQGGNIDNLLSNLKLNLDNIKSEKIEQEEEMKFEYNFELLELNIEESFEQIIKPTELVIEIEKLNQEIQELKTNNKAPLMQLAKLFKIDYSQSEIEQHIDEILEAIYLKQQEKDCQIKIDQNFVVESSYIAENKFAKAIDNLPPNPHPEKGLGSPPPQEDESALISPPHKEEREVFSSPHHVEGGQFFEGGEGSIENNQLSNEKSEISIIGSEHADAPNMEPPTPLKSKSQIEEEAKEEEEYDFIHDAKNLSLESTPKELDAKKLIYANLQMLVNKDYKISPQFFSVTKDGDTSYHRFWLCENNTDKFVLFDPSKDIAAVKEGVEATSTMPYILDSLKVAKHFKQLGYTSLMPMGQFENILGSPRKHWTLLMWSKDDELKFFDPKNSRGLYNENTIKQIARELGKNFETVKESKQSQGLLDFHNCGYYISERMQKAVESMETNGNLLVPPNLMPSNIEQIKEIVSYNLMEPKQLEHLILDKDLDYKKLLQAGQDEEVCEPPKLIDNNILIKLHIIKKYDSLLKIKQKQDEALPICDLCEDEIEQKQEESIFNENANLQHPSFGLIDSNNIHHRDSLSVGSPVKLSLGNHCSGLEERDNLLSLAAEDQHKKKKLISNQSYHHIYRSLLDNENIKLPRSKRSAKPENRRSANTQMPINNRTISGRAVTAVVSGIVGAGIFGGIGAIIGTIILPGAGTVVGASIGAAIGGVFGASLGGSAIYNRRHPLINLPPPPEEDFYQLTNSQLNIHNILRRSPSTPRSNEKLIKKLVHVEAENLVEKQHSAPRKQMR